MFKGNFKKAFKVAYHVKILQRLGKVSKKKSKAKKGVSGWTVFIKFWEKAS